LILFLISIYFYFGGVQYVCLYVCNTITFETYDLRSSFLLIRYILPRYGSSAYMKVIGQRSRSREQKRRKSLFLRCKTLIGNNFGSTEDRAVKFARSMRFSCRIEWRDRHLCHVTESDHS